MRKIADSLMLCKICVKTEKEITSSAKTTVHFNVSDYRACHQLWFSFPLTLFRLVSFPCCCIEHPSPHAVKI